MRRLVLFLVVSFCPLLSSAQALFVNDTLSTRAHVDYILTFLDAYKQAYKNQNLAFIDMVFCEDAVIITESMELQKAKQQVHPKVMKSRKYRSMVDDKKKYIAKVGALLNRGPILLDMADVKIMQHNKRPYLFGVNFVQELYSDFQVELEEKYPGYVFLMIDFKNDIDNPVIHVKTWQPAGNIQSELDIYYLYDFQLFD